MQRTPMTLALGSNTHGVFRLWGVNRVTALLDCVTMIRNGTELCEGFFSWLASTLLLTIAFGVGSIRGLPIV